MRLRQELGVELPLNERPGRLELDFFAEALEAHARTLAGSLSLCPWQAVQELGLVVCAVGRAGAKGKAYPQFALSKVCPHY